MCTSSYEGFSTAGFFQAYPNGFLSGAVELFPCGADGKPAAGAASIGTYTYNCGAGHNLQGGISNVHHCSNMFTLNGCTIAQVGEITNTFEQIGTGVWSTGPTTSATKHCPKASAYQKLAFSSVPDANNRAWERYAITVSRSLNWIGLLRRVDHARVRPAGRPKNLIDPHNPPNRSRAPARPSPSATKPACRNRGRFVGPRLYV